MTKRNAICATCKKELNWIMENVSVYRKMVNDDLEFIMIGTKYTCPKCGNTIITDFGERFSVINYDQKYLKKVKDGAGEAIELI